MFFLSLKKRNLYPFFLLCPFFYYVFYGILVHLCFMFLCIKCIPSQNAHVSLYCQRSDLFLLLSLFFLLGLFFLRKFSFNSKSFALFCGGSKGVLKGRNNSIEKTWNFWLLSPHSLTAPLTNILHFHIHSLQNHTHTHIISHQHYCKNSKNPKIKIKKTILETEKKISTDVFRDFWSPTEK